MRRAFPYLILLLVAIPWLPTAAYSQSNITTVEYFIDTDPGVGNGTAVTGFSANTAIDIATFNIPTTSLAIGRHIICIRAKNANNAWGYYECRAFYISGPNTPITPDPPPSNITALEYFFDTAPAPGSGTPISVTPGTDITLATFNIPTTSLSTGWHILGVRGRNANGKWGYYDVRRVYIQPAVVVPPASTPSPIVTFEYSIDTDPGVGNGTFSLPVTPSTSVDLANQNLNVGALALGSHKIVIRGKDQNNKWGFYEVRTFSVCNQAPTVVSAATAITTTSFTANWSAAAGATSYQLDVSKDNFATFVTGYNNKTILALSETISGLTTATTYQYRVRAVSSCASDYSTGSTTTLLTLPTAQPTGLNLVSTSNSLAVTFSAASGSPTGYLVIRKAGVSPSFVPVNNAAYTQGQVLADGVVAYAGTTPAFLDAGLSPDVDYHYDIFSYNQSGALYSYLTTAPLQGNRKTLALEPASQPTTLVFASVAHNGFNVSFTSAAGTPAGYLVLRSVGAAPTAVPVDGTTYTTVAGSDVVAHNGSATSFSQTGLTQNTGYHYAVYAYNGSGTSINYRQVSPLPGSQFTLIAPPGVAPSGLTFTNVTPGSMTVSYTAPGDIPSGYLVVRKTGSNPSFAPQPNTIYNTGQILSDGVVAYSGPALSFGESGLSASTAYFYDVFAYNSNGSLVSYQNVAPLEGSKSTFTAEPVAQPSSIAFSETNATSMKVSFTGAIPPPTAYLVLRKAESMPASLPVDGVGYTAGNVVGDATVAFEGSTTTFADGGLLPGTVYYYRAFSFNGSNATANYLATTNPGNLGSKITVPDKPGAIAATSIQQNQFTANWNVSTGASNYRVDVSKDNFSTIMPGFDGVTATTNSFTVTGLEPGVAYQYRTRAENTSGTSGYSDVIQQFTIPATPVLSAATNITQTSFTANWPAVPGTTAYFIDVSLSALFTSFETGYENKPVGNAITTDVEGLKSGTPYYYRIRASNTGGASPSSENSVQIMKPATPLAIDAASQQQTSFIARWESVVGATFYEIEVALESNNFSPILFTKNDIPGNETSYLITQLTPNTAYRYRVRARNSAGASPNSNSIPVSTREPNTGGELQLLTPAYSIGFTTGSAATVEARGGTAPYTIEVYHRKIMSNSYDSRTLTLTGASYRATFDESMLDELGVEFYFKATDAEGATDETVRHYIYRAVPSGGIKIPFTKSGGVAESYELFSIPYQLSDNLIETIFNELGDYNKSQWRLAHYENGRTADYEDGINRIEVGKGYWFNRKAAVDISFVGGTVTNVNQAIDATIRLAPGWNQVGNPLPFDIDWDDILTENAGSDLVSQLRVFNPTAFHLNDESNTLKAWGGGFVHNGNSGPVDLRLPVTLRNTSGGRKGSGVTFDSGIDRPNWFVPIIIQQGPASTISGIGMHPEASPSIDRYDDVVAPRFLNYQEFYIRHDEFFTPKFSRDIVPTCDSFTWDIAFESNIEHKTATLQWDQKTFGENNAQLLLYDLTGNIIIDMRLNSHYTFAPASQQKFRIFFGIDRETLRPDINILGHAYPNPFGEGMTTNIPFTVTKPRSVVIVNIVDVMGRNIKQLSNTIMGHGFHQASWDGKDDDGEATAPGLYIYQLQVDQIKMTGRVIKR